MKPLPCSNSSFSQIVMDRRAWLAGASALVATSGCTSSKEIKSNEPTSSSSASDVPLRVVWVGTDSELDTIRRTWQSISEQPLDLRLASASQHDTKPQSDLIAMAAKADVVVYPLTLMAGMIQEKRLMPLLESERRLDDESDVFTSAARTSLPPALKVATSFAGQQRAVPLGGQLPALILGESVNSDGNAKTIRTWTDYHTLAQQRDGKCAEPTAAGWAGAMYLWRLSSSLDASWLFDRESLEPLLRQPQYEEALQQMSDTVQLNPSQEGDSPGQIHQKVAMGELDAGIGFPLLSLENSSDMSGTLSYAALPSGTDSAPADDDAIFVDTDLRRLTMNPFMLVGSLAASCRQTAAANQFLRWLSGGQGSEPLYRTIDSLIDTRRATVTSNSGAETGYRPWLKKQLANPNVVSTLQLLGAQEYYRVLDEAVRECVTGKMPAAKACDQIANAWAKLHQKYDLPSQQRAWRRAQGIG